MFKFNIKGKVLTEEQQKIEDLEKKVVSLKNDIKSLKLDISKTNKIIADNFKKIYEMIVGSSK